jgi:RNA polymerase sigma factor (sigma-70 family)
MNTNNDQAEVTAHSQALFPYAYNILGSIEDAKDVVQDVLTKHLAAPPPESISNLKSYLVKSVVNHAINTKNRLRKTLNEGEVWLPEPVATDDAADRQLQLREILSYSLLVLMERLTASERAVFILRESFDYSHEDIAAVLSISVAHSRKLISRAKERLFKPAPKRSKAKEEQEQEILERYISAIRQRNIAQLEGIMNADIRYYADGGGKVPLAASLCLGAHAVAELQTMIYHKWLSSMRMTYVRVNHQPAYLFFKGERLIACQIFELSTEDEQVLQINTVLDPDKLKGIAAVHAQRD